MTAAKRENTFLGDLNVTVCPQWNTPGGQGTGSNPKRWGCLTENQQVSMKERCREKSPAAK